MIRITNIETIAGHTDEYTISEGADQILDGTGLTLLPALIDPHVHFRVPGGEHKEDWQTGAAAAIAGGVTTVLDMPNNTPACTSVERLREKRALIDDQLKEAGIPLRYQLYIGAHQDELPQLALARGQYVAIKVFLGQSTGSLLMNNDDAFDEVCRIAAQIDTVVAVHAENDTIIKKNEEMRKLGNEETKDPSAHSKIRSREAAIVALEKVIEKVRKYGTRTYVLHASTAEEVEMIRAAKKEGLPIFLETTPHHLFLSEDDYATLGTKAQMNPPLRTKADQAALWAGIKDGTIDTVGTDHAPHTLLEKAKPYGDAPSGVPGIETLLPLLLTAVQENKISLEDVVRVTRTNAETIFRLPPNEDVVLVDLKKTRPVRDKDMKTKCGWSPFAGMTLIGWPVYTIIQGNVFKITP